MPNRSMMNRRTVLKTAPVLVALSAGCTGGQEQSTPTSTPVPTTQEPQQSSGQQTTQTQEPTQTATGTPTFEDALADLTEKAKEEGEVVIRALSAPGLDEAFLGEELKAQTGIEYTEINGTGTKQILQSATEMEVGKLTADVQVTTKPVERLIALQNDVVKQNTLPPSIEYGKVPDSYTPDWDDQGRFVNVAYFGRGVAYNTNLVSEDEVPTTFDELLDEKWRNSILTGPNHLMLALRVLEEKGSWEATLEWLEAFRPNIKKLEVSSYPATLHLGQGQAKLFPNAPDTLAWRFRDNRNMPLEVKYLNDVAALDIHADFIYKDAPHPNAARLYLEMTKEDAVHEKQWGQLRDYPPDRDKWPQQVKDVIERGRVLPLDLPFVVEATQVSGLSLDQLDAQFKQAIGAG